MSLIYEPKGKAREYSPLALNVYSGGCDHACRYCYCRGVMRGDWGITPRPRDLSGLAREAAKAKRQVLLSFIGDPYCRADVQHRKTREALTVLRAAGCSVAILTKGGSRCLRDLDLFVGWPGGRLKVGATLTMFGRDGSSVWEPGAADPVDRLFALKQLHECGIQTWASIEPVIWPADSIDMIAASLPYVDAYKVGRWNHDAGANGIDWRAFGQAAVGIIKQRRRSVYVKADLRAMMPDGFLQPNECDQDALTLPDRPDNWMDVEE